MADEDRKTLERKIDFLIEESEKMKQKRKRDKALSKIDGVFYSLIALSTFISGLIINQLDFLTAKGSQGLLLLMVAVVLSMLFSFIVGFKGMLYDSIENRILAWCLLLVGLVFYSATLFIYVIDVILMNKTLAFLVSAVLGLLNGLIHRFLSEKFTHWVEARLTPLLGQKIDVFGKIKNKILGDFLLIYLLSLAISITMTAILQKP